MRIFLIFLFLPFQYWVYPCRFNFLWFFFINFLFTEFKILINYSYSNLIIFLRLLLIIFFNNFLGLFPYIFTASRHIRFCFSFSISLWFRILIYRIFNYFNDLLSHLTPQGTPFILIPFIIIIESIRLLIRPITLAVRLIANIVAGHLLLSLLGTSFNFTYSFNIIFLIIIIQSLLFILEIAVSIIQAYVFSILSTLYRREF